MSNWHVYGNGKVGAAWKLKDGVLRLDASKKSGWQTPGGGDIVTNDDPETQVADNKGKRRRQLDKTPRRVSVRLMSISKEVVKPAHEWTKTEVIANDGKLNILVNDQKVLSTKL